MKRGDLFHYFSELTMCCSFPEAMVRYAHIQGSV